MVLERIGGRFSALSLASGREYFSGHTTRHIRVQPQRATRRTDLHTVLSTRCTPYWLPLVAWLTITASFDAGVALAQDGCVSGQCHATLLTASTVHPVAEACDGCHESVLEPHPQKGKTTFKLTQEPPDMCSTCHEAFGTKSHVHFPVSEGMCTTCHNPHASDQPKLLQQPLKDLCGSCHADHLDFEVVHGPVSAGDCTTCHTPHESDTSALLLKEGQDLCFGCHLDIEEALKKKNVHGALSTGCTSCHNPHGSAHPKLLAEEGQQLCFNCHAEIGEQVKEAPVQHAAVQSEDSCASCHSPHGSDNPKLLLEPAKDICMVCHDGILTQDMEFLHGPIKEGMCGGCHNPHGGQYPKLLADLFPQEPYVAYTETAFPLCFRCHNRDMVQYPETSFATNFRDGETNLHNVHVNDKRKGRSCRLCHVIHGGSNPKLIARSVPFGKWDLPLNFVKTETGGGCTPGCHKPAYYDRKTPGKKPDIPADSGKRGRR